MIDDYSNFCEMFFAAHYLPIALYKGHQYVCSAGFYDNTDPYPFVTPKLCDASSPSVYVSSDTGYYGYVVCKDKQHFFILGPAYSTPPDRSFIRSYMTKNGLPIARYDEIASFLTAIPLYTYNQFLELLLFLHFILNGEKLDLNEAFRLTDTKYQLEIGKQQAERAYTAREEQAQHGTYLFEQQMLSLVRQGDVIGLENFLLRTAKTLNVKEGKLAETPLRQAKNLLIGLVVSVGKDAAIPGGMDIEETYQLIDTYTQECEKLQSEDSVKNLQYNMTMDFANRVAMQKSPRTISADTKQCLQYITTHINQPIGVSDVVAHSSHSRSSLLRHFKEETGMSVNDYITLRRMKEAASLLRYTDKSLGEISSYLCFSSQSYFQNVFKKHYGITPLQYRNQRD